MEKTKVISWAILKKSYLPILGILIGNFLIFGYIQDKNHLLFQENLIKRAKLLAGNIRENTLNNILSPVKRSMNNFFNENDVNSIRLTLSDRKTIVYQKEKKLSNDFPVLVPIYYDEENSEVGYYLEVGFNFTEYNNLLNRYYLFVTSINFLLIATVIFAIFKIYQTYKKTISILEDSLEGEIEKNKEVSESDHEIEHLVNSILKNRTKALIAESHFLFYKAAKQVAHDIRSPISALDMIVTSSSQIPSEEKKVVTHAVRRINDIANNFLNKHSPGDQARTGSNQECFLPPLIESILSEKRAEYRGLNNITIDSNIHIGNATTFIDIDPIGFKRVISNLINNSIEAMSQKKGSITIDIRNTNQSIFISVTDTGAGFPKDVLSQLFKDNFISQKPEGSGIGLSSAKDFLKKYAGELIIENMNIGARVSIELPRINTPKWFSSEITIKEKQKVHIIDDDESIHGLWNQRIRQKIKNVDLISSKNFDNFYSDADLYLVDYEFTNTSYNGIDKILSLGLKNTYLVTSHYDEVEVQKMCLINNIKIIPKDIAHFVPINSNNGIQLVLIDDDRLLRLGWDLKARGLGISIKTYSSYELFLIESNLFDLDTPIYIDSDLQQELKGEEYAKLIFEKGFKHIYLCTGFSKNNFSEMNWIKDIVSKDFPV